MVVSVTNADTAAHAAAGRYLQTGQTSGLPIEELVVVCNQLVRAETERSSKTAVKLGRLFVKRARRMNPSGLIVALRAHGWACVVAGLYVEAEQAYLEARGQLRTQPLECARIDRILIDVYMYRGDFAQARRRARSAMRVFRARNAHGDLAKTEVNFANLLHRLDRHREARDYYHRAGRYFSERQDYLPAAFCWYNEANTYVQLFQLERAEELYQQAREVFQDHNHELRAIGCLYGLAWLHMLQARLHLALSELAQCEDHYRRAGQPREYILCQLDRAEVMLGLNLCVDAQDVARGAERRAIRMGIRYEAAKAAFFLGKALLGLGRPVAAHNAFERARRGFELEGNQAFRIAVDFHDSMRQRVNGRKLFTNLRSLRMQIPDGQLPLWEALCDLELLSDLDNCQDSSSRLARNRAIRSVPQLRARYLTRMGNREQALGNDGKAVRHWSDAAAILSSVRADLPPIDMRASFTLQHREPYERLIEATVDTAPLSAGVWLDRFYTAGVWQPERHLGPDLKRFEAEQSLADLAGFVHVLSSQSTPNANRRDTMAAGISAAQRRQERRIRDALTAVGSDRAHHTEGHRHLAGLLRTASSSGPVLQLHATDRDVIALIHENGQSRSYRYADRHATLQRFVGQWRFLVESLPHNSHRGRRQAQGDETAFLERLTEWLWRPLEIASGSRRLLLLVSGAAANLPWSALGGPDRCLIDQRTVVMAPSIQHHAAALRNRTRSRHALILVGENAGLKYYRREFQPLLRDASRVVTLIDRCRRCDWPDNSAADIWHFTGHADVRTDNPLYSSLALHDGPIFAADFRLRRNTVNTVVLAACRTAQRSQHLDDESSGLIRALLEMGARNVIASHWAVNDKSAAAWSSAFYEARLKGVPVADCVRQAALLVRSRYPLAYDWAAFSMNGAG